MIPQAVSDVDLGWLARALHRVPARLVACRISTIGADTGFASHIGRVALTWGPPGGGPASVVVKLSDRPREARFYRDIGDYAGLRVPHAYHAATDDQRAVVVMEDLIGARFGDAAAGLSLADIGRVIDALAALHARWWESPRLAQLSWMPTFGGAVEERLAEHPERLAAVQARHPGLVASPVAAWTARVGVSHAGLFERLGGPPATLLHVDCHPDNIAFLGDEPVLYDWQHAARGAGAFDLASLLSSALRGPDEAQAPGLLDRYGAGLAAGGVDVHAARLHEDYRVATLRLWIGILGGLGSPQAQDWPPRLVGLMKDAAVRMATLASRLHLDDLV